MLPAEVIAKAREIVAEAGYDANDVNTTPLDFFDFCRDVIKQWPRQKLESTPWLAEFATGLRRLRDDFEAEVRSDPLILYKPAHQVALDFHQSTARIRYYRGGNRISKTQAGLADNYWVMTGQHPYRPRCPMPASVAIVGVNFSKYAPTVFETKYIHGENGNPLSPAFPEDGRWFHHYDQKKHMLTICCPECAAKNKAKSCRHPKSTIILFSDTEGSVVLQGGQYAQIQFDEQIQYEFLGEALKRLETVPNSGLVVTETPLNGKGWWTNTVLARDAAAEKVIEGTDIRLVSLHTIDQFEAGLTPHALIKASMELMSPAEIEARVYGRPASFNEHGVFDSFEISVMENAAKPPRRGNLYFAEEFGTGDKELIFNPRPGMPMHFEELDSGPLRVWKEPRNSAQYIIGGDVAMGLTKGDPSAASVLEMIVSGHDIYFDLVAQLHGWMNPRIYAEDLVRLAIWYNGALIVPERNGPGGEAIRSIVEFGYWNLFRDASDPASATFGQDPMYGVHTNVSTKSLMVACLQQCIKDKRSGKRTINIPCFETLDELGAYGQHKSDSGLTIRFGGAPGMNDDRVISLMVAVYAAKVFGVYDYSLAARAKVQEAVSNLTEHERQIWEQIRKEEREAASEW